MAKTYTSSFVAGADHYKFFDSYDKVTMCGRTVGYSMFGGYSYNKRAGLSLGVVDPDVNVGDVRPLVWGEEGGGNRKSTVERHKQLDVRVKVSPVPYARDVRESYNEGWRTPRA